MNLLPRLLLVIAIPLSAAMASDGAPVLATWVSGDGVTATPSEGGWFSAADAIYEGQEVATAALTRFAFAPPASGTIVASPGTRLRLHRVDDQLVVDLLAGIVEVSLTDRGAYAGLRVEGGRAQVQVTGTLFVVERVASDKDFVAVVSGHVRVSTRQQVGEALAETRRTVDLSARQGLSVAGAGPLGQPLALLTRPNVATAVVVRPGISAIAAQSLLPDAEGTSWSRSEDELGYRPDPQAGIEANAFAHAIGERTQPRITDSVTRQAISQVLEQQRLSLLPAHLPGTPPAPPPQ